MASIRNWKQSNRIEVDEVEFDGARHAFEISFRGKHLITIYSDTPGQSMDMRASLDDGEDVREWEDGDGVSVGTLLFYATSPYSMGD